MYHGPRSKTVKCMECKWQMDREVPGITLDTTHYICHGAFNHIRQEFNSSYHAPGNSVDKSISPSAILSKHNLLTNTKSMLELILCMPFCGMHHQAITTESRTHSITLRSFKKKHVTWVLQNERNFTSFLTKYCPNLLTQITFDEVITLLSDINLRHHFDKKSNRYKVIKL